ncbi:MAG: hypothetical protein KKB59_20080 [Spirochaetes bacterium]|nr:hypothetical protein [Spirochaetota bacterium]
MSYESTVQSVESFLEEMVNALMQYFQVSPADMTVILEHIQSNVNPYVSAEELEEEEDAPTEEMARPVAPEELRDCKSLSLFSVG